MSEREEKEERDITILKDHAGREIRLSNDLARALEDRAEAQGFQIEALPGDFNPMQTQVGAYVRGVRDELFETVETVVDSYEEGSPFTLLLREQAVNLTSSDNKEKLKDALKKSRDALVEKVKDEAKGESKDGNDYLYTEGKPGFVEPLSDDDFKLDMTDDAAEREVQRLQRRLDLDFSDTNLAELKTAVSDAQAAVDAAQTAFYAEAKTEDPDAAAEALRLERSDATRDRRDPDGGPIAQAKKALDDTKKALKTAQEKEKRFPDQKKFLEHKRDALKAWQGLLKINQKLAGDDHFALLAMNNLLACAQAETLFHLSAAAGTAGAGIRMAAGGASCPFSGDEIELMKQYQQHFSIMNEDHFTQRKASIASLGGSIGFNVPYGFMYMEKNGQFGFHWSGARSPEASDAKEVVAGLCKTGLTDIKANSDSPEFLIGFAKEAILQGVAFTVKPNFLKGTQELMDVDQRLSALYNPVGAAIREAQKDKTVDSKDVVAVYARAMQSDHFRSSTNSLNAFIECMGVDRFKHVVRQLVMKSDVESLKLLALRVYTDPSQQGSFKAAFAEVSGSTPKTAAKLLARLANDPIMTLGRWASLDASVSGRLRNSAEALLKMMMDAGLEDAVVDEIFGEEGKRLGKLAGDDSVEAKQHVSFLLHHLYEFDSATRGLTVSSRAKAMVCIEKMVEAMFKEVLLTIKDEDIDGSDDMTPDQLKLAKHEKARNMMNTKLVKFNQNLQAKWRGSTKPVDLMMEDVTRTMVEAANAISLRELAPANAEALNASMTAEFNAALAPASGFAMRTGGALPVSPDPAHASVGIGVR